MTHAAIADSPQFRTVLPRPRRRRHPLVRWYRRNERVVLSIAGVVAFFLLWQIGAELGVVDKFFFSAPTDIAAAAWEEIQNPRFWEDMKISGWELFVGSAIALVISIPVAF